MSDILTSHELDGIRYDFDMLLGLTAYTPHAAIETEADIYRSNQTTLGPINPVTLQYDEPLIDIIYSGASHFAPMAHRRDRQEIAGGETQRIRQYVALVPWNAGDIHLDDTYHIRKCSDPNAIDKKFIVTDVRYTSLQAARVLTLTDISRNSDPCNDPEPTPTPPPTP